ncbi:hypothetical protein PJP10_29880 [Mycobacterium kansasii]
MAGWTGCNPDSIPAEKVLTCLAVRGVVGVGPSRESASIGFPLTRCVRRFGGRTRTFVAMPAAVGFTKCG